ncbi:hypothetical protein HK101_003557 [Irineochytrium annulatum]|nr:hypothetical protein HK101_003557 [Irineochytrium annulatum]
MSTLKRGYLEMMVSGEGKLHWNPIYGRLRARPGQGFELAFYPNSEATSDDGRATFVALDSTTRVARGRGGEMILFTGGGECVLRADGEEERERWISAIKEAVHSLPAVEETEAGWASRTPLTVASPHDTNVPQSNNGYASATFHARTSPTRVSPNRPNAPLPDVQPATTYSTRTSPTSSHANMAFPTSMAPSVTTTTAKRISPTNIAAYHHPHVPLPNINAYPVNQNHGFFLPNDTPTSPQHSKISISFNSSSTPTSPTPYTPRRLGHSPSVPHLRASGGSTTSATSDTTLHEQKPLNRSPSSRSVASAPGASKPYQPGPAELAAMAAVASAMHGVPEMSRSRTGPGGGRSLAHSASVPVMRVSLSVDERSEALRDAARTVETHGLEKGAQAGLGKMTSKWWKVLGNKKE